MGREETGRHCKKTITGLGDSLGKGVEGKGDTTRQVVGLGAGVKEPPALGLGPVSTM